MVNDSAKHTLDFIVSCVKLFVFMVFMLIFQLLYFDHQVCWNG